jgi:hypothetical protein
VPQLTPLLVSNPGDSFDPADPWFGALDPSAQGKAFSRCYGFVMDAMADPLPAGTQIWIRKLSGSAGLSAYRYQETAPRALQPIFGNYEVFLAGTPTRAASAMNPNKLQYHLT